jgi:hypothetical protein
MKFASLLTLIVSAVWAQEVKVYREGNMWVEETRGELPGPKNLKVTTDYGSIRITGGAQSNASYVVRKRISASSESAARGEFDQFKVHAGMMGDTAVVKGVCQRTHGKGRVALSFEVQAPRNLALVTADTGAGPVTVNAIGGKAQIETGGGPITVDDIGGTVVANTGGGAIEVGTITGDAQLETGGGDVRVRKAAGSVHAETGGGNFEIGDVAGPVQLETGGGNIRLSSAGGAVSAETGGGNIQLMNLWSGVNATSGAGQIVVGFNDRARTITDSRLETNAGNVMVMLPGSLPLNVRATVESGSSNSISSEFNDIRISCERGYGPQECLAEGKINSGGPLLKIGTSVGSIRIQRASK